MDMLSVTVRLLSVNISMRNSSLYVCVCVCVSQSIIIYGGVALVSYTWMLMVSVGVHYDPVMNYYY